MKRLETLLNCIWMVNWKKSLFVGGITMKSSQKIVCWDCPFVNLLRSIWPPTLLQQIVKGCSLLLVKLWIIDGLQCYQRIWKRYFSYEKICWQPISVWIGNLLVWICMMFFELIIQVLILLSFYWGMFCCVKVHAQLWVYILTNFCIPPLWKNRSENHFVEK